jgi:hypothetical protein
MTQQSTTEAENEINAMRIGMVRAWFQDHPRHPHYDLTEGRRIMAVKLGAVEVKARE